MKARLDLEADRSDLSGFEVGAHRRAVHEEGELGGGAEAEDGARAEKQGADVQRALAVRRHEGRVRADDLRDARHERVERRGRHRHARRASRHACGVLIRAEEHDLPIRRPLRLEPLEYALAVIEHLRGWVKG